MRYMLAAFPLVGVVVGGCIALWCVLAEGLSLSVLLTAAGATLIPVAVTGGIHLDGFCDVVDALSSHASPERRREILKDPRAGAFAVIGVASYLIAYLALAGELFAGGPGPRAVALLALVPVLSRVCSGLGTLLFPKSEGQGMLSAFQHAADVRRAAGILGVELVLAVGAAVAVQPLAGTAMAAASLVWLAGVYVLSQRAFGGMSGDVSGYFLQVDELLLLLVIVIFQRLVTL